MIARLAGSARCYRIAGASPRVSRGAPLGAASPVVRHQQQRRSAMAASIGTKQDMLNTPVWRRDRMVIAAQPSACPGAFACGPLTHSCRWQHRTPTRHANATFVIMTIVGCSPESRHSDKGLHQPADHAADHGAYSSGAPNLSARHASLQSLKCFARTARRTRRSLWTSTPV